MSASSVSSAAIGRPFIFASPSALHAHVEKTAKKTAEILAHVGASPKLAATVVPASRLDVRPAPEMVSSGISQLDALTGGFPRGFLSEICGLGSSGRTSILLVALARATQRGEVCALVDTSDAFDPASAVAAGVEMSRLLWVRCGEKSPPRKHPSAAQGGGERKGDSYLCIQSDGSYRRMPSGISQVAENEFGFSCWGSVPGAQAGFFRNSRRAGSPSKNPDVQRWESHLSQMLKVTDLLLQSNGFGMIALDLGDVPVQSARRIPLASWFRFRRAIEHTPTVLLVLEQQPIAGSCSSVLFKVSGLRKKASAHPELAHAELLDQLEITAELLRSRLERKWERKPVQSTASFNSRAAWAG
jgi:recombination protein RecA